MNIINEYDFTKPQRYTSENLKSIKYLANDFIKKANIYVGDKLRLKYLINMDDISQLNYLKFNENIKKEDVIIKISAPTSVNNMLIKIDKHICFKWIDVACGGDGNINYTYNKELTNIDKSILRQVIQNIFSNIHIPKCNKVLVEEIYTYANMISFYPNNESICSINMTFDEKDISINIAYSSIEPILDELGNMNTKDLNIEIDDVKENIKNNLSKSTLTVSAQLGKININVCDLLKLEEGDVIFSENKCSDDIEVYIEDKKVFKSSIGIYSNKKALKINDTF